jgi:hypothetical protein
MTTAVLSVGEERGGFTGIFEIVAADKARVQPDVSPKQTPDIALPEADRPRTADIN